MVPVVNRLAGCIEHDKILAINRLLARQYPNIPRLRINRKRMGFHILLLEHNLPIKSQFNQPFTDELSAPDAFIVWVIYDRMIGSDRLRGVQTRDLPLFFSTAVI